MKVTMPGRNPDFLGFGVHRSGSTWLNAQLEQHPDVWLPKLKEVHYFDERNVSVHARWHETRVPYLLEMATEAMAGTPSEQDLLRARRLLELATSDRDNDWYRSLFGLADPGVAKVGEITPAYSMMNLQGMKHVHRVNPDVRIFLVLREPAERVWSHLKLSLSEQIKADRTTLNNPELLSEMARKRGVVRRTQYRSAIESLEEVFPAEQIYVSFFERVSEDPVGLLRDIATHIGVDPDLQPLDDVHAPYHTSPAGDLPDWLREACATSYRSDVEWLAERYDTYPARWLATS